VSQNPQVVPLCRTEMKNAGSSGTRTEISWEYVHREWGPCVRPGWAGAFLTIPERHPPTGACGCCAVLIGVVPQPLALRATPRQPRPSPSQLDRRIDKGVPGLLDVANRGARGSRARILDTRQADGVAAQLFPGTCLPPVGCPAGCRPKLPRTEDGRTE